MNKFRKDKTLNVVSFGGGIQTVALMLMSIYGDLPKPDAAIFADPGWELDETYEYLSWFISYCQNYGIDFHVVKTGNIRRDALCNKDRFASMPLFTKNEFGKQGILRRQCTSEYKIRPVYKRLRKLMGLKPYERTNNPANVHLGISIDEATRIKPSRVGYANNVYPLVENNISRSNCISYISAKGFPLPPKSACVGCPYHSDRFWADLKKNNPKEFQDAVDFDKAIRNRTRKANKQPVFLHRSLKPLGEVDFTDGQLDMFDEECEGYCGL